MALPEKKEQVADAVVDSESAAPAGDSASESGPETQRRRHARLTTPLHVEMGGHTYKALDWSLGGFRIGDVEGTSVAGNMAEVRIIMPFERFDFSFKTTASIRWIDLKTKQAGCQFENLTADQKSTLGFFVASFIKGRTLTVEEAVQSIKPDVDDISVSAEGEVNYKTRWHQLRLVRRIGIQASVAALALVFLFLLLRTVVLSTFSFDSTAAWIDAPPIVLTAPIAGRITSVDVAVGDAVTEGDVLARFRDENLTVELTVAQAELTQLRAAAAGMNEDALERGAALDGQEALAQIELDEARARLLAAQGVFETRQEEYNRAEALVERGAVPARTLDEAERNLIEASLAFDVARAEVRSAEAVRDIAQNGYFFGTSRIAGDDPGSLARSVEELEQRIVVQEALVKALEERMQASILFSPCDCIVTELPRRRGERLAIGQNVMFLSEIQETPHLVAFVTHREAAALAQGQKVSVRLSDGTVDENAIVSTISTHPTPTNARLLSSRGHEPSLLAEVSIALTEDVDTLVRSPVDVIFVQSPWLWLERMLYLDF